ncbi:MAG: hypothetical protein IPM54_25920 [Polyangiaceae bacterium]|nr:hypothetical protein [Polyangiaceae bacterium]
MFRSLPALALALALFSPAFARADVPPPDGQRRVSYRFRVDGVAKLSPDHIIVVYPWSLSNGAPTREQTVAPDGEWVSVGRRSYRPELHVVRKADYEEFVKTHVAPEGREQDDPALDAFLSKGAKCNLGPMPNHTISEDDPRSAVEEIFVAQTISDTSCVLTRVNTRANAPKSGGCAGCTTSDNQVASGIGLAGLLFGLGVLVRRRRRG